MDAATVFSAIVERRARRQLLLLFDFDGTLCPFDPDPDNVHLTGEETIGVALLEAVGGEDPQAGPKAVRDAVVKPAAPAGEAAPATEPAAQPAPAPQQ